jgi:hypothetical protein
MKTRRAIISAIVLATSTACQACAAPPAREVQSPRDAVTELRAALATMSDDELAPAARLELERARAWVTEADQALTKEAEPQTVALLIELSRGQLVLVKSVLERKKAEAALSRKSEEFRKAREALESVQGDSRAIAPSAGEEP